jgi:hypothetical protein
LVSADFMAKISLTTRLYFNDILIYSKSLEEHIEYLRAIFGALCEARLFANLEKCTFCTDRVTFLGYVVTP